MGVGWKDIPKEYKPHWSTWKIEGTPYEGIQQRLAKIGLRDPWLRNDVWRHKFTAQMNTTPFRFAMRGCRAGLLMAVTVIAFEHLFTKKSTPANEHH